MEVPKFFLSIASSLKFSGGKIGSSTATLNEIIKLPDNVFVDMIAGYNNAYKLTDEQKRARLWSVLNVEASKIKQGGNRCVTMITYLNDVQDGGGTVFPVLGFAIQALQGRVLMFGNLDEHKIPHPSSLHMGLPPEDGDKWILTFWFREKDIMATKKELNKVLNSKKSTSTEKKPIDAKLHAKNVFNKFKC